MSIKKYLSKLLALVLVVAIGLTGCSQGPSAPGTITGNFVDDTLMVIADLTTAINSTPDDPNKAEIDRIAHKEIQEYASRYRRNAKTGGLKSFTTMQTAVNALASYYTAYGSRPIPPKVKERLEKEFKMVEVALKRGS